MSAGPLSASRRPVATPPVLSTFATDDIYSKFLNEDFDVRNFTSQSIEQQKTGENKKKLKEGIEQLQGEINGQVTNHSGELLNQVNVIKDLEKMLVDVHQGVEHLEGSVGNIKEELNRPYEHMKQTLTDLERVQKGLDIMRKTKCFWDVCCSLKQHMGLADNIRNESTSKLTRSIIPSVRELPTTAQDLRKLEIIGRDPDLKGIDLVEKENEWILRVRQEVHTKASQMLVRGLETQNQVEVTNSLQVFFNLRTLADTIQQTIGIIEEKMNSSIQGVLDFSALEKSSKRGSQQTVEWKAVLWTRMEKLVDVLYQCCVQIWHLQRVLNKNGFVLPEINLEKFGMTKNFWDRFATSLERSFLGAAANSSFIENTFVNDYSRLVHIFCEFIKRLQSNHEVKQAKPVGLDEESAILMKALGRFEASYSKMILDRIIDPLRRAFPDKGAHSLPSVDDIYTICKHINVQLEVAQNTPQLIPVALDCVNKVVSFFSEQVQGKIANTDDAYQVSDKLSAAQIRNSLLFNITFHFYDLLSRVKRNSPKIQETLQTFTLRLVGVCNRILDSLFHRETIFVEKVVLSIHSTDYNTSTFIETKNEGSRFVQILRQQIYNFCNVILSSYTPCSLIDDRSLHLTQRILRFFVRHASLVRPLSESGKLRLAGDMAQLESAVTPLMVPKNVGEAYKALRAFKPFIFQDTQKLHTSPELQKLQPIDVLHHLFSRGSSEIQSPHAFLGWSINKYSAWLDTVPQQEAFRVIQKSLEAYAKQVNLRGEKQYDPIYPLVLSIGPSLFSLPN